MRALNILKLEAVAPYENQAAQALTSICHAKHLTSLTHSLTPETNKKKYRQMKMPQNFHGLK